MKKFLAIAAIAALFIACEEKPDNTDDPNPGGPSTENPGTGGGGNSNVVENYKCLQGSNYFPIIMDAVTYEAIKGKVVADLRVDDYNTWLWIWENTYAAGTATGPNYFGEVEGWVSLQVGSVGWSGAGFCCYDPARLAQMADITANPADYVFHIAMKSQDSATHELVFYSDDGSEAKVAIDVNGAHGYARDGEWYEIEIPVTELTNNGLLWTSNLGAGSVPGTEETGRAGGHNVMAVLSGTFGALNMDACFFYKPAK